MYVVIHYHDLKKEVAKNVKLSMKTDTVDIFITGPFCNAKAGTGTWIAVFGDYGSAWTLILNSSRDKLDFVTRTTIKM